MNAKQKTMKILRLFQVIIFKFYVIKKEKIFF